MAGAGTGGVAVAQSAAPECVALADPALRLACYDRLHGRVEAPSAVVPTSPALAAPATAPPMPGRTPSRLGERWELDGRRGPSFAPRAYRPVYLLPATWTDRVNLRPNSPSPEHGVPFDLNLRPVEAKYQLSLKAKFGEDLFGTRVTLWGGYTQSSRWQLYNGADSRPFRETNYEPELMLVMPMQASVMGWNWRMASLSLTHQSNGRALPLSRSWNRVIASAAFERDDWVVELRPWVRLQENPDSDDNPDIADYVGRGEIVIGRYTDQHSFSLQLRHSLRGGGRSRGSAKLEWVFTLYGVLHGYLQVFGGYGESMVDYNLRQNKVGLGVTIAGWR